MRHNETHRTSPPKAREECGLLGEGGTYGNIAGSLENVKQNVERNDCSDEGGGERKRQSPFLQSVQEKLLYRHAWTQKMPLAYLSNIVAIFPNFSIYDFNYTKSSRRKPLTTIPPPARTIQQLPQSLFKTRTDPLNHVRAPHHGSCHLIGGFQLYIYIFFHMR